MVRAILEGRKTQTRRVCVMPWKGRRVIQSSDDGEWYDADCISPGRKAPCPYGVPGDRLWVRESGELLRYAYDHNPATGNDLWRDAGWRFPDGSLREARINEAPLADFVGDCAAIRRPSIYMPRWASRLTLEVKAIRVERLQEISEADAEAEGIEQWESPTGGGDVQDCQRNYLDGAPFESDPVASYRSLWDSINAKRGHGWETSPWVWVVEFERAEGAR